MSAKTVLLLILLSSLVFSEPSTRQNAQMDPCEAQTGLLMEAEFMRLKGHEQDALMKIEEALRSQPDCLETMLLYADILFEMFRHQQEMGPALVRHLNRSIQRFPDSYEFQLLALEICLFSKIDLDSYCQTPLYLQRLDELMQDPEATPRWAQAKHLELRAEIHRKAQRYKEAALAFEKAWSTNREGLIWLSESASMYEKYGMLRTAFRLYSQFTEIMAARTGRRDGHAMFKKIKLGLLLNPNEQDMIELLQISENENALLECLESLLRVGHFQTCHDLLPLIPTSVRNRLAFQTFEIELAKRLMDYQKAYQLAKTQMEQIEDLKRTQEWDQAFGLFLDTCLLSGNVASAMTFCQDHQIKFGDLKGYPRMILALILFNQNRDRTLWNQAFYARKLSPSENEFRMEAETVGLDLTLSRLVLRQYTYYRDGNKTADLITPLLLRPDLPFNLKLEMADSLAICEQFKKAFDIYDQLILEKPNSDLACNNYGYFLLTTGTDLERAELLIRRANQITPNNHAFLDSLAWLEFKLGNYEIAKQILEPIAMSQRPDPTKLDHLGDIYHALGQVEKAQDLWSQALRLFPQETLSILDKLDPPT